MSGCSVPETEDLYCDDELHPSLEKNPNMQLFSAAQIQHSVQNIQFSDQQIFQSMDAGIQGIISDRIFYEQKRVFI